MLKTGKFVMAQLLMSLLILAITGCSTSIDEALEERAADIEEQSSTEQDTTTDNTDSNDSSDDDQNDDKTVEVDLDSSLILLADSAQLKSGGTDSVRITANVKDQNNIVLEGETVAFSANSGSLQIEKAVTDSLGNAVAILSSPHDPSTRTVKITATGGNTTQELNVDVVGTAIEITGPVNAVAAGTKTDLFVKIKTGDGGVLKNTPVAVSSLLSNPLSDSVLITDDQGQTKFTVTDANGATDTIKAEALNGDLKAEFELKISQDNSLTFTSPSDAEFALNTSHSLSFQLIQNGVPATGKTVELFINRGEFVYPAAQTNRPNISVVTDQQGEATVQIRSSQSGGATIQASTTEESAHLTVEFIATNPETLKLDSSPSTVSFGQTSQLTALVRDINDNLVKNAEVVFHIASDITTGSLESSGAVKTNSLGQATAVYKAGESASGNDGVEIEAYIAGYDEIANKISDKTKMTVEPANTRIIVGTGNVVKETANGTQYEAPYIVQVSDDGRPVAGAEVTIQAYPINYHKGSWVKTDIDGDLKPDQWAPFTTAICPAEDLDQDAELDLGEDINNDGELTPPAVVSIVSSVVTTDENGFAEFSLFYPQNHALWLEVELIAQTSQADGEAFASTRIVPGVALSDISDIEKPAPGGSPFGHGFNCNDIF